MIRLGSSHCRTREMDLDDIFISRVKLLIVMGKSFLEGAPLGEHRRMAMLANARHVGEESMDLGGLVSSPAHLCPTIGTMDFDHMFYQRVKLLAVMIKAVAKGFPVGEHRKTAMQENLDMICESLGTFGQAELEFLKVA